MEISAFKEEGFGEISDKSGNNFSGNWKNCMKNGQGNFLFANGDYISGEWENDILKKGFYVFIENGNYYEGPFDNNCFTYGGFFVIKSTGMYYTGTYLNNKFEGEGEFHNKDQSLYYTGSFSNDKPHGVGTLFPPHSTIKIEALWENGFNSTLAQIFDNDRLIIKCPILNGYKQGKGEFFQEEYDKWGIAIWNDDIISKVLKIYVSENEWIEGDFDSSLTGNGRFFDKNKAIYEGYMEKLIFIGTVKIEYKNKDFYIGDIKDNDRNGVGKYYFYKGELKEYDGEWNNGKMHGKGILYFRDGKIINGFWKKGKFKYEM